MNRLDFGRIAAATSARWGGYKGDVTLELQGQGLAVKHASSGLSVAFGPVTKYDMERTEDGFMTGVIAPALDAIRQKIDGK